MEYRRLGRAGLQVSVLTFGSWVTFGSQLDVGKAPDCLSAARDAGVNFFDNAEGYAGGESERIMGKAIAELGWERKSYVVSSKFFWGLSGPVNDHNTLNRKYLMGAVDASLQRFGLDFLDIIYCHRPDANTPIEETVWAMSDLIATGKALYWGTSEWAADEIRAACEVAERHHLRKPVVEQPHYNLLTRRRVEREYARLYEDWGIGTTIFSPLASGLLSGKYIDGIPEGSRASLPGYEWLKAGLTDPSRNEAVKNLKAIADELDCTLSAMSLAWCAKNPNVSSVITGASTVEQVRENMTALDVLPKLTPEVMARIDEACKVTKIG
jgi:voltage-dependent potassium channel beta subunit